MSVFRFYYFNLYENEQNKQILNYIFYINCQNQIELLKSQFCIVGEEQCEHFNLNVLFRLDINLSLSKFMDFYFQ